MNSAHQKIIDAVIARAEAVCPQSVALIGVYGSVATGDEHAKSDLDLLILIKDDDGWQLGSCFILEDSRIGYDIYCTNWESLRSDAECHHAQLAKLMDSEIIYVKDQDAVEELNRLREQTRAFLQAEERYQRVNELLDRAKLFYANACLYDTIGKVRMSAAEVMWNLLDSIMIYHGCYFRRGTKRTFDELSQFPLDGAFTENMRKIAGSKDVQELRGLMKQLILYAENYTMQKKTAEEPSKESVSGSYEEMYSNWRNKVEEAAAAGDAFSAFMNMASLQSMICDIASEVQIGTHDLMETYDADCLENNVKLYDEFLAEYEKVYEKAGITVNRFSDADSFAHAYTAKSDDN